MAEVEQLKAKYLGYSFDALDRFALCHGDFHPGGVMMRAGSVKVSDARWPKWPNSPRAQCPNPMSSAQNPMPNAQCPQCPNTQCPNAPMPNAQCPNAPMPQCPMPNAQCPMPQCPMP
eukprot:scaffold13825_cov60-Phaeocystis_antarctica.AAC.6